MHFEQPSRIFFADIRLQDTTVIPEDLPLDYCRLTFPVIRETVDVVNYYLLVEPRRSSRRSE